MSDDALLPLRAIPFRTADGASGTLADVDADTLLVVNVASRCGFTPQYEQLEELQRSYGTRGFSVVAFPCNQFLRQEPGTIDEIVDYCSQTWGVSFPVFDKVKVNGRHAAPVFRALKQAKDPSGSGGPVRWNFEKFVVGPDDTVHRFRSAVRPDDPAITGLIERGLSG